MSFLDPILDRFRKPRAAEHQPAQAMTAPQPAISHVTRRMSLAEELRGKLAKTCDDYGYSIAHKSGRRTADPALLKTLEALAESKAREIAEALSQMSQENLLRRLKDEEAMLEQRILHRDGAANKLYAAQQALAATPDPGAYPEISPLVQHASTGWFTMSVVPTCHDLLTGLEPTMKWIVGIAAAFGMSTAIVNGILPASQADLGAPVKGVRQHGALAAGVLLGLAFLGLRLAGARSTSDLVLAGGLALMELGAVVLVERKAKTLAAEIEAWRERMSVRRLAEAKVLADQQQLDARQQLVENAEQAITEIEDGLERAHAVGDTKTLVTIAVNAMRAGCARGIAENAASLGGAA